MAFTSDKDLRGLTIGELFAAASVKGTSGEVALRMEDTAVAGADETLNTADSVQIANAKGMEVFRRYFGVSSGKVVFRIAIDGGSLT